MLECCRWDRAGLVVQWASNNVLNVKDWTWDKEGFCITGPEIEEWEATQQLPAAERAQVKINRVKFHYHEVCHLGDILGTYTSRRDAIGVCDGLLSLKCRIALYNVADL